MMNGALLSGIILATLAALALVASWLVKRRAAQARKRSGLPTGRIVYADTGDWRPADKPLFSATHGLTGKPDYLVQTRTEVIPIEVKSRTAPRSPYPSHLLQLAAYCLLVEEETGQPPSHGLIQYADATFEVEYTPTLRRELLSLLTAIREARDQDVPRSHDEPTRCKGCGYQEVCDESLV